MRINYDAENSFQYAYKRNICLNLQASNLATPAPLLPIRAIRVAQSKLHSSYTHFPHAYTQEFRNSVRELEREGLWIASLFFCFVVNSCDPRPWGMSHTGVTVENVHKLRCRKIRYNVSKKGKIPNPTWCLQPSYLTPASALLPIRWEPSLVHPFIHSIEASTSSFHNTTLGGGYFGRLLEVWGVEAPDGRSLWEARVVRRALPVLVVGLVLLWPRLGMVRCGLLLGMRRALYP